MHPPRTEHEQSPEPPPRGASWLRRALWPRSRIPELAAVVLGVCLAGSLRAGAAGALKPVTLQLKWYHQFQFAGYYAAQVKGYYAAEGLDVTLREGGPGRSPITTVLDGTAHFGVGDSDVVLARLRGSPLVACAAIFQHSPYIILSRRDRNIRTPSDLVGRRVMMSDDPGDAQFRAMLTREGIALDLVTFVAHSWR